MSLPKLASGGGEHSELAGDHGREDAQPIVGERKLIPRAHSGAIVGLGQQLAAIRNDAGDLMQSDRGDLEAWVERAPRKVR